MAKKKDAEAPAETATAPAEKITQRVAVQRALAAGVDSPADGVAYVKKEFGITLNNQGFSTIKSQLKKAAGESKPAAKRGRPAASANGAVVHKPVANAVSSPAELARAVKELVAAHGVETVKDMVDVFAK
jgi:hypothetical protein